MKHTGWKKSGIWLRAISLCLVVTLAAGLLPMQVLAESVSLLTDETSAGNHHFAAYTNTVTVDGALQESAWLPYGQLNAEDGTETKNFGALWDAENLYLGGYGAVPSDLAVMVNGRSSAAEPVSGESAWELKIPLADVGVILSDYNTVLSVAISADDFAWNGTITCSPANRCYSPVLDNIDSGFDGMATETGHVAGTDSMRLYNKYSSAEGASNSNANTLLYYARDLEPAAFTSSTNLSVLEFDFTADAMPVYFPTSKSDLPNYVAKYFATNGFDIQVQTTAAGVGYSAGITNVKDDDLYFVFHSPLAKSVTPVKLNKAVGDTFHIRLEHNAAESSLKLYVDDVLLSTYEGANVAISSYYSNTTNPQIVFNLYRSKGALKADGSQDSDVTVSGVRVSTIEMESVLSQDLLDLFLTDALILNENETSAAVTTDLYLPSSVSSGIFSSIPVTWISSNPDIIDNTGKIVSRPEEDTTVTLTAALAAAPSITKTFAMTVSASSVVEMPNIHYFAIHATDASADGKLNEAGWRHYANMTGSGTDTKAFGAIWDKDYLYLGGQGAAPADLTVQINGKSISAVPVSGESAWEIKLPLNAAGITLADYNELLGVSISSGNLTWSGNVHLIAEILSASDVALTAPLTHKVPEGTENVGSVDGKSVRFAFSYPAEGATDGGYDRSYMMTSNIPALGTDYVGEIGVVEFDFRADAMKNSTDVITGNSNFPCEGFVLASQLALDNSYGYNVGITKLSDQEGLSLVVKTTETGRTDVYHLNQKIGDTFHIRLEYRPAEKTLSIYCDGVLLGTSDNLYFSAWSGKYEKMLVLNSYNLAGTYAGIPTDFTVSNLTAGVEGKTAYGSSTLAAITIDRILGENTSENAINSYLTLPAVLNHPVFGAIDLVWTSSNPAVIGNDGTVATLPTENTAVTLTVALKEIPEIKKEFVLTVVSNLVLDAVLDQHGIVVDGNISDPSWMNWKHFPGNDSVNGSIAAAWSKGYIYFAVTASGAESLTLEINGKTVTVKLEQATVSGAEGAAAIKNAATGILEIRVPMEAVGVNVTDYNDEVTFGASLENGDKCNTMKETFLGFSGAVAAAESLSGYTVSGSFVKNGDNAAFEGVHSGTHYIYMRDTAIDHSKTVIVSQELKFDSLPITDGTMLNAGSKADGFYAWISNAIDDYANKECICVFYAIFTEDGENLKIRVLQDENRAGTVFDLSRKVGEAFRLSYIWNTDNSVSFYADGTHICTLREAGYVMAGNGDNLINWRYTAATEMAEEPVKFSIENVHVLNVAYESVLDELTPEAVLGRVDLKHVQRNLNMVDIFATRNFASLPLTWQTTDASVVETDGTIHRHATEARTATITLLVNGVTVWTADVTVDPLTVTATAAPTTLTAAFAGAPITIDGSITDEGWVMNGWVLDGNQAVYGSFGTQWDQEYLYIAFDYCDASAVKLKLGGKEIAVDLTNKTMTGVGGTIAVSDTVAEIRIPVSEVLNVTKISAYGYTIPISVEMDGSTYQGILDLSSVDWWGTVNFEASMPIVGGIRTQKNSSATPPDEFQGGAITPNGFYMFDVYGETGSHPTGVRVLATFMTDALYNNFDNRSQATHIEFDIEIAAMPARTWDAIKNTGVGYANCGINWSFGNARNDVKQADTIRAGIAHMDKGDGTSGLIFVVYGAERTYIELDKKVGDQFRVGMTWDLNGDLLVYIDGQLYHTFVGAEQFITAVANNSFVVNLIRDAQTATSSADNMEVYMTNIAFGRKHNTENIIRNLTFDDIRGENENEQQIIHDLNLITSMTNDQMDTPYSVTWASSDESVIKPDGTVIRPETGFVYVTLTATLTYEDNTSESKEFKVMVQGKRINAGNVLVVAGDTAPNVTPGTEPTEYIFTLDGSNNSVVYCHPDGTENTKVNLIKLTNLEAAARLTRESLRLYISEDNTLYSEIRDFKLIHIGKDWYIYGFETTAKFIKVHYTHVDAYSDASFINEPGELMHVSYDETLNAPADAAVVTVTADALWQDKVIEITLPQGVAAAGLRVSLNGYLLYHYVEEGRTYVRIPDLAAGTVAQLKVWSAADALELSNKEDVYEISYGTVESRRNVGARWLMTVPAGTEFPNGTVLEVETIYAMSKSGVAISTDGGYTFTHLAAVKNNPSEGGTAVPYARSDGGWGFDSKTGRLFYEFYPPTVGSKQEDGSYDKTKADGRTMIISSDDGGLTWNVMDELKYVEGDEFSYYMISYSDIVELSGNDGAGPNVDFVLNMGSAYDNNGGFCGRVAYSVDGGFNWELSASIITYPEAIVYHEDGISECTILEREDGTLVLYARCQFGSCDNFGVSYSLDHGITWSSPVLISDVYTVNTQPIMLRYDFDKNGTKEATLLTWGGNNVNGGNSRTRNPFNIAISTNGMDTFRNIQNAFSGTWMEHYDTEGTSNITNQSVAPYGDGNLMITYTRLRHSDSITLNIIDFDDWFIRNKGAYDSFEHGVIRYEGWTVFTGNAEAVMDPAMATEGSYYMQIGNSTQITRSVPYLQSGSISMNLYVTEESSFDIALQPAFASSSKTKYDILNAYVEGTTLTIGTTEFELETGWNTVTFQVDLFKGEATLTVNDAAAVAVQRNNTEDNYICYVSIRTNDSAVNVDEVLVVDNDPIVATIATDADKAAANGAIDQIKSIGDVTIEDAALIASIRATYEAMPQVQQDLVNRNVPTGTSTNANDEGSMINYYEVLMEAEEAIKTLMPELPKISGNLSLNETIDINFIIPAGIDVEENVLVVKNAATSEDVEYTILPGIGGTTVVRYRARANHMTDEITVQVFDAEGNALTQKASMSVRKYAGIRLTVANDTEKMMLIRMLDYGALAQINSGVITDLANSIVTDELRAFADAYDWADAVQLEVPAGSGGVFKAGLALNETIDVTVYTAATNVAEGDKFVVKCNGEELAEDQYIVRLLDDGRYVIRYSVKSNEMSDEIYIAIVGEDNTVKAETTLGVRIYAQKFLAAVPNGNQAAMLLAMLDYGTLAQIYAGTTENLANCFVSDTLRQVLIGYPWPAN